jgi:hypothetical protein
LIGGWVESRADLDDGEKRKFLPLPGLEVRPLGDPARSQSLSLLFIELGTLAKGVKSVTS